VEIPPDAPPQAGLRLWSLRDDVVVDTDPATDTATLITRWGDVQVDVSAPVIRECLDRMTLGPVALDHVAGSAGPELTGLLDTLHACVVRSMDIDDLAGPLLSVVPISERARFRLPAVCGTDLVRLSRFAAMRTSGNELVLESPLAHHRVVLHRALAGTVAGALGRAGTVADIAADVGQPTPLVAEIVAHLRAGGMVVAGSADGQFAEDLDPRLAQWSHHDLAFHVRSRLGRHDEPIGATYRHVGRIPPLPAVKPTPAGARFPLHRPELDTNGDASLTDALERRRSFRTFATEAPTAAQLGELLFRTARIRTLLPATGAGGVRYTVSDRPYPTSDALYEIELYVTVDACGGLSRGLYHYDPLDHALTRLSATPDTVAELLDTARIMTGSQQRPPVLITMAARMARLSWVYDGIAYATAVKHVGVLQQTMYLVATAMGLAPCALAAGASDAAIEALDWPAEVTIGEFVIGLRPTAHGNHTIT
jgi:SagB-type dehydrogenase family enzyme